MKARDSILASQTSNVALCLSCLYQEVVQAFQIARYLGVSHFDVEHERQQAQSAKRNFEGPPIAKSNIRLSN